MWTILTQLWTDPTAFRSACKTAISFAGALLASGIIPTTEWKYGFIVMALAHVIPAGERNRTA